MKVVLIAAITLASALPSLGTGGSGPPVATRPGGFAVTRYVF
jgi:hypothetical protein